MAETAGLVVGAVGLAGLFDSCMNAFQYVESGANYGREYQKMVLKVSLQQLRLSRWAQPIELVDNAGVRPDGVHVQVANTAEAARVEELLGETYTSFEGAERPSTRHR